VIVALSTASMYGQAAATTAVGRLAWNAARAAHSAPAAAALEAVIARMAAGGDAGLAVASITDVHERLAIALLDVAGVLEAVGRRWVDGAGVRQGDVEPRYRLTVAARQELNAPEGLPC
jgi:hypothetical protein